MPENLRRVTASRMTGILLPLILGTFIVLQGAFNRRISAENDLASTVLLNSSVLLAASVVFYLVARASQPEGGPGTTGFGFRAWYILPGLLGFGIVAGVPWGIERFGALKVFVGLIAAQLVASLAWDAAIELRPVTLVRAGGSLIAFLSAALVIWKG